MKSIKYFKSFIKLNTHVLRLIIKFQLKHQKRYLYHRYMSSLDGWNIRLIYFSVNIFQDSNLFIVICKFKRTIEKSRNSQEILEKALFSSANLLFSTATSSLKIYILIKHVSTLSTWHFNYFVLLFIHNILLWKFASYFC